MTSPATSPALRKIGALVATYWAYLAAMMSRGLELVGKLGLYMLGARILGVHDSGYFFLCLTWVGVISTIARIGHERAVVRHISGELALGKGKAARRALLSGGTVVLGGSAVGSIVSALLAAPLATYVFRDPDAAHPLFIASLAILPQAACYYVGNALIGFHQGAAGQLVQNGLWPLLTLAALAAGVHSLDGILAAFAVANLVAAVIGMVLLFRQRHQLVDRPVEVTDPPPPLPHLWRTSLPLWVVEVMQILLPSLPVLLLASFGLPSQVGAFSVANRISMLVWVVSTPIGAVTAPSFTASHQKGEWDKLRHLNRRMRLLIAIFGLPIVAAMLIAPAPLLHIIGPGFEIAAPTLFILGLGQLVYCLLPCQEVLLAMCGHGNVLRRIITALAVVCALMCVTLIPAFGMIGAAICNAVNASVLAIACTLAVRRLLPRAF